MLYHITLPFNTTEENRVKFEFISKCLDFYLPQNDIEMLSRFLNQELIKGIYDFTFILHQLACIYREAKKNMNYRYGIVRLLEDSIDY